MNINGWNYIHIMARGPALLHPLNGRLITATIDDDPVRRKMNGCVAPAAELALPGERGLVHRSIGAVDAQQARDLAAPAAVDPGAEGVPHW